ncbi:MAG: VOC family protein [Verrucomicrobiales bacterium]
MKPQLARVVCYVRDVANLAEWYCETFDLEIKFDAREDGWIELEGSNGCSLAFHTIGDPSPACTEIAFVVSDIGEARRQLAAKGIDIVGEIMSWRHYQCCKGRDPEGNTFQLINPS